MAIAYNNLPDADSAALVTGHPWFIARNVIANLGGLETRWSSTGSWGSGIDCTEPGYPMTRAWDGYTHLPTRPNAAATTWYFLIRSSTSLAFEEFGAVVVVAASNMTVRLELSESSTFSSIAREFGGYSHRYGWLYEVSTGVFQSFGSCLYARLKFTSGSAAIPLLYEATAGMPRIMKVFPDRPYDVDEVANEAREFEADSGVISRTERVAGKQARSMRMTMIEDDYVHDVAPIREDSCDGLRPIWLCERALSLGAYKWKPMMMHTKRFAAPRESYGIRRVDMRLEEQGGQLIRDASGW